MSMKVKVEQGWLEGEVVDLVTGDGQYYSFKGVPYAAPPLGTLRFKAPQPPRPWEGMKSAKEHGPVCTQFNILTQEYVKGSEDCLYLNVYSPDIDPCSPLPVMFFIHGGGYKSGSGNIDMYGPDFLVDHGVVLVTINYRLDALGFLCLDTKDVPGNAGMKDQVAALKWVKANIANFGGDPDNITVFGESAGGASTMFHVLSPLSKGLFKRAISMSGVPSCDWSLAYQPVKRAFILGKILGKETNDPEELLEFLQSVPAEDLLNKNVSVLCSEAILSNNIIKMYHFTPVIEKDFGKGNNFITENPLEYLKSGKINELDILIGHTKEETLFMANSGLEQLLETYNRYPEMVVPREIAIKSNPDTCLVVADKIIQQYFGNKPISRDTIREFLTYLNHACFVYDILRFANRLPRIGSSKRFLYQFSSVSERNYFGNHGAKYGLSGAAHLDDLMYLFDPKAFNMKVDKNSKEYGMVHLACSITNFVKNGDPTPDSTLGVTWPEYDDFTKSYGDINDVVTIASDPESAAMEYWKNIYEYAGLEF